MKKAEATLIGWLVVIGIIVYPFVWLYEKIGWAGLGLIGAIVIAFVMFNSNRRSQKEQRVFDDLESEPGDYSNNYESSERPSCPPAKWYGPSEQVNVNEYDIPSGFIYVGSNLPDHYGYDNDACLIDPYQPGYFTS